MPEYFDISLVFDKNEQSKNIIKKYFFDRCKLKEGKNDVKNSKYSILANREILLHFYEWEEADFCEFGVSISDQVFNKVEFEKELKELTHFVNDCFLVCDSIMVALCSYEINAYLMSQVKTIKDMDKDFLLKFPITYIRSPYSKEPSISINLKAQDIFTLNPIEFL